MVGLSEKSGFRAHAAAPSRRAIVRPIVIITLALAILCELLPLALPEDQQRQKRRRGKDNQNDQAGEIVAARAINTEAGDAGGQGRADANAQEWLQCGFPTFATRALERGRFYRWAG